MTSTISCQTHKNNAPTTSFLPIVTRGTHKDTASPPPPHAATAARRRTPPWHAAVVAAAAGRRGPVPSGRSISWCNPVPLDEVKCVVRLIGRATEARRGVATMSGITVNDIFVS